MRSPGRGAGRSQDNPNPISTPHHHVGSQGKSYPYPVDLSCQVLDNSDKKLSIKSGEGHQNMDNSQNKNDIQRKSSNKVQNKFKKTRNFELLWIKILKLIRSGMYQKQIAEVLKMRKNTLKYHIDKLLSLGFIEREFRSSFVKFKVTDKGKRFINSSKFDRSSKFSLRVRDAPSRLHNLKIKFPILEDQDKGKWEKETPINNWIKKFSYIDLPVKITIEKTPTHIIAHFHQYETSRKMFLTEFFSWVMRGTFYLYYYLIKEKGIKIDVFSGEVINQHIANHTPEHEENVDKQMTVEISLGRNAQSIMKANMPAKAWIDRSEGPLEIETNDLLYEEKLLMMPELTYDLYHRVVPLMNTQIAIMNEFSKQIALHLEAVRGIKEGIEEFKNVMESSKSYPYPGSLDPGNLDNSNGSRGAMEARTDTGEPEPEGREIPGNLPAREDPEHSGQDQRSYPGPEGQDPGEMDNYVEAVFIGETWVRGKLKHRWECPVCRKNNEPECRFNLSPDKDGKIWKCRFCGTQLLLKRESYPSRKQDPVATMDNFWLKCPNCGEPLAFTKERLMGEDFYTFYCKKCDMKYELASEEYLEKMFTLSQNIAIWINGNDNFEINNIDSLIEEKTDELTGKLMEINKQLSRYHTKKVKGKIYWYKVVDGKWIYCGKEDPRKPLLEEKAKLEKEKSEIEQKIRSCVIKEAGDHLIIDVRKFEKVVGKIPENVVKILEILRFFTPDISRKSNSKEMKS